MCGGDSSLILACWLFLLSEQKEQLKVLLNAKDREEGARGSETVKVQLRSTLVSDRTHIILDFNLKTFVILCYLVNLLQ